MVTLAFLSSCTLRGCSKNWNTAVAGMNGTGIYARVVIFVASQQHLCKSLCLLLQLTINCWTRVRCLALRWLKSKDKGKAISVQASTGPEVSRRLRLPDFKTIGTWRLSALCTGHLYPPGNIPSTHFCCGPGSSVGIVTNYGLESPGSNLGGDEIFRTCPDRPLGPPSLL